MSMLNFGANSAAEVRKLYRGRACAVVDSLPVRRVGCGVPWFKRKSNGQLGVTGLVSLLSNTTKVIEWP